MQWYVGASKMLIYLIDCATSLGNINVCWIRLHKLVDQLLIATRLPSKPVAFTHNKAPCFAVRCLSKGLAEPSADMICTHARASSQQTVALCAHLPLGTKCTWMKDVLRRRAFRLNTLHFNQATVGQPNMSLATANQNARYTQTSPNLSACLCMCGSLQPEPFSKNQRHPWD